MILAKSITKSYGSNIAVNEFSLEVKTGETMGLLGPNGAGKTTAISMLVGLLRPDSGEIRVGGEWHGAGDPLGAGVRRLIGVAPQSLSLYDELTALENLRFFGGLYGLSGKTLADRASWCLEFSGLTDRKKDRVETYSGGMKRRLNIAVALIHEPQVLLLDEPTVGVDPQSRNHIFDSITQLSERGLTIIYTTHYMEEAQRLCDRVAIMDAGKLLDLDTVDNLVDRHGGDSVVTARLKQKPDFETPGTLEDLNLRFESKFPLDEIGKLTSKGVQFQSLQVAQSDLESVFLNLTGRSLRD